MTAAVSASLVSKALQLARKVAPTRGTIPILAHARLAASEGKLTIQATDLDMWLTASVACEGDLDPVTTPAQALGDVVKGAGSGEQVQIECTEHLLKIKTGRARYSLVTLPADNWPDPQQVEGETFSLPQKDLARLLGVPSPAASAEPSRPYLLGTYFHRVEDDLCGVATDGHRLIRIRLPQPGSDFPPMIVPTAVCQLAGAILAGEEPASLTATEHSITIATETVTLHSKLCDGTFPDYPRVIPADSKTTVQMEAKELAAGLERVRPTLKENQLVVLRAQSGQLSLASMSTEVGDSRVALEGQAPDDFVTAFSVRYMHTAIAAVCPDGGKLDLGIPDTAAGGPITVRSGEAVDAVVMPMNPGHLAERLAAEDAREQA